MLPNIPREYTQLCSLTLVTSGLGLMFGPGELLLGVALIGLSCWTLMISESALHNKVQLEMSSALEGLRARQEKDIQGLIDFLHESKLATSPFESMSGAKLLCDKIEYPAMVLTTSHQIVQANIHMHNLLGWSSPSLAGKPVYLINHPAVLSALGGKATSEEIQAKSSLITKYVYIHKTGRLIFGQLDAHKVGEEGFFAVFHPEDDWVITRDEILELTQN